MPEKSVPRSAMIVLYFSLQHRPLIFHWEAPYDLKPLGWGSWQTLSRMLHAEVEARYQQRHATSSLLDIGDTSLQTGVGSLANQDHFGRVFETPRTSKIMYDCSDGSLQDIDCTLSEKPMIAEEFPGSLAEQALQWNESMPGDFFHSAKEAFDHPPKTLLLPAAVGFLRPLRKSRYRHE